MTRDPRLVGHFQTVEVSVPEGARLSLAAEGTFTSPEPGPILAGMLVGQVYQLKVTGIPFNDGVEVFPTIEVVNRLYAPAGKETRFPVPVELTIEELEMAVRGLYVTRVIYLEDSASPVPSRQNRQHQVYFEVPAGDDPLLVADQLGKPMAILRMGSRIPDSNPKYGYPPLIKYPRPEPVVNPAPSNPDGAVVRETKTFPRLPLPGEAPRTITIPPVIKTQ